MRGLRVRVLNELHSSHFGITQIKTLAQWWEGVDRDTVQKTCNCLIYISSYASKSIESIVGCKSSTPTQSWRFCWSWGYIFNFRDEFILKMARVVRILESITSTNTVKIRRRIFSTFGLPHVSDHCQFTSVQFQQFLKINDIIHKMGASFHPATNRTLCPNNQKVFGES